MASSAIFSVCKSAIYGLGFYQSYRYSRSLAVGWKEQKGLCALDHVQNIAMLVIAGYANIEALKGTTFANRIWNWSYSAYAIIPMMYWTVNQLDSLEKAEETHKKLSKQFPPTSEDDARSLGERMQSHFYEDGVPKAYAKQFPKRDQHDVRTLERRILDKLQSMGVMEKANLYEKFQTYDDDKLAKNMAEDESGGSGILEEILRQFPKSNKEDQRLLGERVDAALENHQMSDLKKTMKSTLDFAFMHVSDFVLIASVIHTVAAIRIGFNRVSNLVQLFFYGWAVAEQGLFLTQPEEDQGPLISLCDGDIVRAYDPPCKCIDELLGHTLPVFLQGNHR